MDVVTLGAALSIMKKMPDTAASSAAAAEDAADRAEEAARTLTIDDTLSKPGQAADAKVVGDNFFVTLTGERINGYNIYPSSDGFYNVANGAVDRFEIESDVKYLFNFTGYYILSNSPIIAQHKEVCTQGAGFANTSGYKYLFISSVDSNGVSYERTVSVGKNTSVKVAGKIAQTLTFDSDPQEQLTYWPADMSDGVSFTENKLVVASNSSADFGKLYDASGVKASDYIDVSGFAKIIISVAGSTNSSASIGIVFYDTNKTPVAGYRYVGSNYTMDNVAREYNIPSTYKYVRTSVRIDTETYGNFVFNATLKKDALFEQTLKSRDNITDLYTKILYKPIIIHVAAYDASGTDKASADYVCDGVNDEVEIQAALDRIPSLQEGIVSLSGGTFNIDSFQHSTTWGKLAIKMSAGSPSLKHIVGNGRYRNSKTIINVTDDALAELGDAVGVVFGCADFVYGRGAVYENINVYLGDNQHTVTVIDNTGMASGMCNDLRISATPPDITNTVDTPMPVEGCIGITGYCGDDSGTYNEMNRVITMGFYEGFRLGGEHLVCKNISGRYNYYAYTFGNYDWKVGTQSHPITLINCCDEHSACLPKFVRCGKYDEDDHLAKQEVDFIGFNLELMRSENFGGGYVAPAEEVVEGAFCGRIDFTGYGGSNVSGASNPSPGTTNNPNIKFWKDGSGLHFVTRNMVHPLSGTTLQRNFVPTYMQTYYDTTLNKMLIYDGTKWVDMMGVSVN